MRMSDWSSDVCASDLMGLPVAKLVVATNVNDILHRALTRGDYSAGHVTPTATPSMDIQVSSNFERLLFDLSGRDGGAIRSEEHTSELQSLMRISYAVFCLKKKTEKQQ